VIVVGIDPSLTATGISVITETDIRTARAGTGSIDSTAVRLVRKRIRTTLALIMQNIPVVADLFVIESPSMRSQYGLHNQRVGLYWMLVDQLLARGEVVEVTSKGRAKYATGNGNADKKAVKTAMRAAFPGVQIPDDNVADSLALALMGSRHLGYPLDGALPKKHLEAMANPAWPTTKGI
jgi:Holliday junction resolvasome RuvABC endonuclease subunit